MKWVVTKIVTPCLRERSISSSQKLSRATGSTPEVGSSRISISGSCSTATASESRCRSPSGRSLGQRVEVRPEAEPLDQLLDARLRLVGRQVIEAGVRGPGSGGPSARRRARRPASCSRGCLRTSRLAGVDGAAEERRRPLGGGQQAGQHLHRRGLAAAVGAEEAEDLAALDREA